MLGHHPRSLWTRCSTLGDVSKEEDEGHTSVLAIYIIPKLRCWETIPKAYGLVVRLREMYHRAVKNLIMQQLQQLQQL